MEPRVLFQRWHLTNETEILLGSVAPQIAACLGRQEAEGWSLAGDLLGGLRSAPQPIALSPLPQIECSPLRPEPGTQARIPPAEFPLHSARMRRPPPRS